MSLYELCHCNVESEDLTDEERVTLRDAEWAKQLDERRRPDTRTGLALTGYDIRRLPEPIVPDFMGSIQSEVNAHTGI